ncbi:hypothetical protein N7523_003756 [Penicillium sp. IBT 18751x]|nr:hypothetical protein N7523_003756 [Penicillium sp. IBT 18751x]
MTLQARKIDITPSCNFVLAIEYPVLQHHKPERTGHSTRQTLEVVEEDGALLGLLTPILNDDARAVNDLAGVTLTVEKADPLAEHLSIGNLDEGDLVLGAKSDNELLVSLLLAALVEDTHVGLTAVEGLGSLTQTTGKTVVDQGDAQDTLQSVEDGHLAGASVSGNLDLVGSDGGLDMVSSPSDCKAG